MSTSDGLGLQRVVGDAERGLRDLLLHLPLEQKFVDLIVGEVLGKLEARADPFA